MRRPAARLAFATLAAAALLPFALVAPPGWALLAMRAEPPAVAARLPEPDVTFETPGFGPGRAGFTTAAEMEAFVQALRSRTARLEVKTIGESQQERPIRMLSFGTLGEDKPTVMVVAMQRGDAPAAGEAALAIAAQLAGGPLAGVLESVNVLIVPRANPDGADARTRETASGIDLDADHLLLRTPEARALADVMARHRPDMLIDLGEFDPGGDWIGQYGGWVRADASLQPATVGNLSGALDEAARQWLWRPVRLALDREGLVTQTVYPPQPATRPAAGGPVPPTPAAASVHGDTLRNVAALRLGASLLVESRGVGLERGHFLRRVHTHVTAVEAALRSAARHAEALRRTTDAERKTVSAAACTGQLVIEAAPAMERTRLALIDPDTGAERSVETAGVSPEPAAAARSRARPCGYLLQADARRVADQLKVLGVAVRRIEAPAQVAVDRYSVDAAGGITLEPGRLDARPGDFFVSMSQPFANLAAAALEPDAPSSLAASGLLPRDRIGALMRVVEPVTLKASDW
jgi:hypothetical protein